MVSFYESVVKKISLIFSITFVVFAFNTRNTFAQDSTHTMGNASFEHSQRTNLYTVIPNPLFEKAVKNGTRSNNGRPGPKYWMNKASYRIHAILSPSAKTLRGNEDIHYTNESPDTLRNLVVELRQNYYKSGNIRDKKAILTGGIHVSSVKVNGSPKIETSKNSKTGYYINGTVMYIRLNSPLIPGESDQLHFAWEFKVPSPQNSQMGQDGKAFFLGYWYPQMSVYDDIHGWDTSQYMGDGEFYMDFADYDVTITVPDGWLVGATGTLKNPNEVLSQNVRNRLSKVTKSDTVVHVVTKDERGAGKATIKSNNGELTWHYEAKKVSDFAFGASPDYVWDATKAKIDSNRICVVNSFYQPGNPGWNLSSKYCRFTIHDMSKLFIPYPWHQMTIMDGTGIINGGMEYPLIALIGFNGHSTKNYKQELFDFVYYETAHMWFSMQVGTNEKAYPWLDEGLTTFNTDVGVKDHDTNVNPWDPTSNTFWGRFQSSYYGIAGSGYEIPSMLNPGVYSIKQPEKTIAAYSKPALVLRALEGVMGKKKFMKAYRTYAKEWAFKHPEPYDFFNTFDRIYGENLNWFWTSMLYKTWTLDQAISKVKKTNSGIVVTVENIGRVPMPVLLQATYKDGKKINKRIPVSVWLNGSKTAKTTFKNGDIVKVEIDPDYYFPDINRKNNVWIQPKKSPKTKKKSTNKTTK